MDMFFTPILVFIAAFVQGVTAFGSGLVLMPGLSLCYDINFVTPLVAMLSVTMNLANLASVRQHFRWDKIYRLLIGAAIGVPLGVWALKTCPPQTIKRILGAVIVCYAVYGLLRPRITTFFSPKAGYPFGFLAGMLGGAFNVNGPVVAVYTITRHLNKVDAKMVMSTFLLITGLFIVTSHAIVGLITQEIIYRLFVSLPPLFAGAWLGGRLFKKVDQAAFVRLLYVMLIFLGSCMFLV